MNRRNFVSLSAAAGLAGSASAAASKPCLYHLLYYYMRQTNQTPRTQKFLSDVWLPAARRAGIGPVGLFSPVIGPRSPYFLVVTSYPSYAALEAIFDQFSNDKEYAQGFQEFHSIQDPPYMRLESELLRAIDGSPALEIPPTDPKRPARVFELRTYESLTEVSVRRKARMFDDGEARIFRRIGMATVFFGIGVFGANLPKLTYMVGFDDMAARDKAWSAFGADPEWKTFSARPGLSNAELVSNVSNVILRPLPFSPIR